jgi:predicted nicotinamide N-methyase
VSGAAPALANGSLARSLRRRFRTAVSVVETAAGAFTLLHPANADDLLSEADFVRDERLPYWADIWPSSTVLAGVVGTLDGRGQRMMELGCGLGLVASAAARAGFDVTATDYYEDALLFARLNAWEATRREITAEHVDWRSFPATLGRYDLVVASDVLYEKPYADLVSNDFAQSLAPAGRGLVADPGRIAVDAFLAACTARGLDVVRTAQHPWTSGEIRQTVDIYEIRRQAVPGSD